MFLTQPVADPRFHGGGDKVIWIKKALTSRQGMHPGIPSCIRATEHSMLLNCYVDPSAASFYLNVIAIIYKIKKL